MQTNGSHRSDGMGRQRAAANSRSVPERLIFLVNLAVRAHQLVVANLRTP
jgi:hypothetical protein